jgi:hypothetical protein
VAVEVSTGHARAVRIGRGAGADAQARVPPPPGFEGGLGTHSSVRAAQAARCTVWDAATAPAWSPGLHRLTVVAADRVSNETVVEVTRSNSTVDPAVLAATAAEQEKPWPPPDPTGGLPRYDSIQGSLEPPPEPGVVVAAERVVTVRPGAACVLYGAVRARSHREPRASRTAVTPVTLVVTGTETPGPIVVSLRVPSFDRLTARFAVDLFRLASLATSPQTYFVHAFTADGRGGPVPVAVVAG